MSTVIGIIIFLIVISFIVIIIAEAVFVDIFGLGLGASIGITIGTLVALVVIIAVIVSIVSGNRKRRRRNGSGNPLGLCNACLAKQLYKMNLRGFLNSAAFNGFEGKLALLTHLKDKGCCPDCVEKGKNHVKSFVNSNELINIDVDEFYRDI